MRDGEGGREGEGEREDPTCVCVHMCVCTGGVSLDMLRYMCL